MIKAVIFDMDGTLLDTLEDLYLSANAALESQGFPRRSKEEVRRFVGNGVRNLMRQCIPDGEGNSQFEECFRTFGEHYAVHLNDHTSAYEGIQELLTELSARGYLMAIVSNKPDAAVKDLAGRYFGGLISVAIGESESIRRKPAPDTVIQAAKTLGVPLFDCIYVGDSEVDIRTAANSGIPCVSVSWGFRERELLESQGAERIVDRPGEILKLLLSEEV